MKHRSFLISLSVSMLIAIVLPFSAWSFSEPFIAPAKGTLFSSYDVKNFELTTDFTALLAGKNNGFLGVHKTEVKGVISYLNENAEKISVPVKIRLRGFTSLGFCTFPKMEIKISKNEAVNTLFQGLKSVDLNTHCVELNDPNDNPFIKSSYQNHREAYLYQIMDILKMPALRARPVLFNYKDTNPQSTMTADPNITYQAFFIEDTADLRKKNNLTDLRAVYDPTKYAVDPADTEKLAAYSFTNVAEVNTDKQDLARIALFEWLIGNTDWYVKLTSTDQRFGGNPDPQEVGLWNIKAAKDQNGKVIFIPQDFNFAAAAAGVVTHIVLEEKVFNATDKETRITALKSFLEKKTEIIELIPKNIEKASEMQTLFQAGFERMEQKLKELTAP